MDSAVKAVYPASEYLRPWKLATLLAGFGVLVAGAFYYEAPDWDIGVSLVMAILSYLTAPWSAHVLAERRWKLLPLALLAAWITVDGSYSLYWYLKNPATLAMMRDANLVPSLFLYVLCGLVWYFRGSLAEMMKALRA